MARDLRADREAHGGRLTTAAARRAVAVAVLVAALLLVLVVWPLVLGDSLIDLDRSSPWSGSWRGRSTPSPAAGP